MNNETTTVSSSTTTPQTYQVVLGCVTFFLVLPFVLIPITRYPLGSTGAVLVGAFLMVVTTVISQADVYTVIGDVNNLKTIFLLWGMMIISSYFEREHLIDHLLNKLFPAGLSFHWWLLRLSIIDSILAALFTNDVACVILTPLIINKWVVQKRDQIELNTLLLTLATQANIGSTLTIFGNPQMALMASKSNAFVDLNSHLQLKTCVIYLWLPVFVVWLLNLVFLLMYHRLNQYLQDRKSPEEIERETSVAEQSQAQEQEQPFSFVMSGITSLPRFTERYRRKRLAVTGEQPSSMSLKTLSSTLMINRSVSVASFPSLTEHIDDGEDTFQASHSIPFKIILFTLLITVIALLFASNNKVDFDIGLVPVGAAILLLVADTLINHQPPLIILSRIDWNVLLLFFGLFVWLNGLNSTNIPHRIWVGLGLASASFTTISSILLFYIFTIIGSNVFSNVPLTLLVLEQVPLTGDHLSLVLYLAFITTIAGNLTLFGSVANLIVAQKALASPIKHRFTFLTYLKFGFPTTIVLSLVGTFIIYGLLQVIH